MLKAENCHDQAFYMDTVFEMVVPSDNDEIVALGEYVNEKQIIPSLSTEGQETMRKRRRRDIEETVDSPIYESIKAVYNGEIVGYIAWRNGNYIAQLYVMPKYQGRNVGRNLIAEMLRASDARSVELKSSTNAVGFYEKMGFRIASDEQKKDGVSFVPMIFDRVRSA